MGRPSALFIISINIQRERPVSIVIVIIFTIIVIHLSKSSERMNEGMHG
jgi:hypothetical protein